MTIVTINGGCVTLFGVIAFSDEIQNIAYIFDITGIHSQSYVGKCDSHSHQKIDFVRTCKKHCLKAFERS